jgi:hypothetical protein
VAEKPIGPQALAGKLTDVHTHVGISLKAYANSEYPYAQSLEGLYYRQKANGVDYSVVFTYTPELYFDLPTRSEADGPKRRIRQRPYALENRLLYGEIYQFWPMQNRFLPFVSVDPVRISEQLAALEELAAGTRSRISARCSRKAHGLLERRLLISPGGMTCPC